MPELELGVREWIRRFIDAIKRIVSEIKRRLDPIIHEFKSKLVEVRNRWIEKWWG